MAWPTTVQMPVIVGSSTAAAVWMPCAGHAVRAGAAVKIAAPPRGLRSTPAVTRGRLEAHRVAQCRQVILLLLHHGLGAGLARRREAAELDGIAGDDDDAVEAVAGSVAVGASLRVGNSAMPARRPAACRCRGSRGCQAVPSKATGRAAARSRLPRRLAGLRRMARSRRAFARCRLRSRPRRGGDRISTARQGRSTPMRSASSLSARISAG